MKKVVKGLVGLIEKANRGYYNNFYGTEDYEFNIPTGKEAEYLTVTITHYEKPDIYKIKFSKQLIFKNGSVTYLDQTFEISINKEEFDYLIPRCKLKIEELVNASKERISQEFGLDFDD